MSVSPEPSPLSTVAHRAPTSSRTASPTRHTPFSTGPPPCARRTPRSRTPTTCPTSPCTSSCAGGPVRLDEICVVLVHAGEHDRGVRGRFAYVDRLNRHPVDAAGVKALGGPGGVVVLEFREGVAAGGGLHGGVVPVHGPVGPPRRPVVGDVGHHDLPLGLVQVLGNGHHEVIRIRIRQRLRRHLPRHGRRTRRCTRHRGRRRGRRRDRRRRTRRRRLRIGSVRRHAHRRGRPATARTGHRPARHHHRQRAPPGAPPPPTRRTRQRRRAGRRLTARHRRTRRPAARHRRARRHRHRLAGRRKNRKPRHGGTPPTGTMTPITLPAPTRRRKTHQHPITGPAPKAAQETTAPLDEQEGRAGLNHHHNTCDRDHHDGRVSDDPSDSKDPRP